MAGRYLGGVVALLVLSLLAGCATQARWPAVTKEPTGETTPGRWVWSELFTADVAAARQFYGDVFGWRFETLGAGERQYTLVSNGDAPIAGILHHDPAEGTSRSASWLAVLSVADVDAAVSASVAGGGEPVIAAQALAGRGRIAVIADPEQARFAVLESATGDPPDVFPPVGSWLWHELWAQSGSEMAAFYRDVGGYRVAREGDVAGRPEWHLLAGGFARAGIIEVERDDLPSTWLQYVRVQDLDETLDKARRAGARVLVAPSPEIRAGRVAVIVDPMGAALGIAEWMDPEPAGGAS